MALTKLNVLNKANNLDPACTSCIKSYSKKFSLQKGDDFDISCSGIPKKYVSDELAQAVPDLDLKSMETMLDPVTWAAEILDWHCVDPDGAIWKRKTAENTLGEVTPYKDEYEELVKQGKSAYNRPWQKVALQCSSKRKVFRIGRQNGKTTVMVIAILHALFTRKNFAIVLLTPYQTQIELIFARINNFINANSTLSNSVKRNVKAPNYTIELYNGSTLKGFTAGVRSAGNADAVRGQTAQALYADECFPKGTQILTSNGLKNIEDIKINDQVWSFNQLSNIFEFNKVLDAKSTGIKKINKYSLEANEEITCTPNHPIWDGKEFLPIDKSKYVYLTPNIRNLDHECIKAAIYGWILSDGWATLEQRKNKNGIIYNKKLGFSGPVEGLKEIQADINILLPGIYNSQICSRDTYSPKYNIRGRTNAFGAGIALWNLLTDTGYIFPIGKKVHQEYIISDLIMNGSKEVKKAFLGSIFAGEGTKPKTQTNNKTSRPIVISFTKRKDLEPNLIILMDQMKQLLEDLGIKSHHKKYMGRIATPDRVKYHLNIDNNKKNLINFFNTIQFRYEPEKEKEAFAMKFYLQGNFSGERGRGKFGITFNEFKDKYQFGELIRLSILNKQDAGEKEVFNLKVDKVNTYIANNIIVHNCDYLNPADMASALSIITNYPDATVWMSSTPTGKRDRFYDICHSPDYKEFYYPSMVNPLWNDDMEKFFRSQLSEIEYEHEIFAKFGEQEQGVYQQAYIERAIENYEYGQRRDPQWIYSIGVDWNDVKIGTTLAVVGYNPYTGIFKLVDSHVISRDGWTQIAACEKVVELNRIWRPHFIYIDKGFGCIAPNTWIQTIDGMKQLYNIVPGDQVFTASGRYKPVLNIWNSDPKEAFELKISKHPEIISSYCHPYLVYESINRFKDTNINSSQLKWKETKDLNPETDFIAIKKSENKQLKKQKIIDLVSILNPKNLEYDEYFVWDKYSFDTKNIYSGTKLAKEFKTSTATIRRIRRAFRNKDLQLTVMQKRVQNAIYKQYGEKAFDVFENIKFNRYIDIGSEEFQILFGWYLSEGNTNKNSVEISQKKFIDDFNICIQYAKNIFPSISVYKKNDGVNRLFINGNIVSQIFKYFGGHLCQNKKLSSEFLDVYCGNILKGFIYGDGHRTGGRMPSEAIQMSITSPHLISQFRQMLIDQDILPSLYVDIIRPPKRGSFKNPKLQYRLDLSGNSDVVNRISNFINLPLRNPQARIQRQKYLVLEDYILVPLLKKNVAGIRDDLIDLQVADDESFTGNGVLLHNSVQYEIITKWGWDARTQLGRAKKTQDAGINYELLAIDAKLATIVKQYDFGSKITIHDPFTKQEVDKPAKPFLVENSVRRFERADIRIPKSDTQLIAELQSYIIDRVTPTGLPVYKSNTEKIGDHNLDALNLALVAYTLEESAFGKIKPSTSLIVAPEFGQLKATEDAANIAKHKYAGLNPQQSEVKESTPMVERSSKMTKESQFTSSPGETTKATGKLWNWPGFEKDAPRPDAGRRFNPLSPGKILFPVTRRKIK